MSEFRDFDDDVPQRRRDYVPAPGRVTVLRHKAPKKYENTSLDLAKRMDYAQRDDWFSIYATVARIGRQAPGAAEIWFAVGDVVTIAHSMFDEIELAPGDSVWCGPVAAVTGKFEEIDEKGEVDGREKDSEA